MGIQAAMDRVTGAATIVEALRAADALAACCMAVDGYSRRELADMARATLPTFTAAIALAQGDAA